MQCFGTAPVTFAITAKTILLTLGGAVVFQMV
jgi:hypothetical protein